ncbi:MAG: TauD/TfdA dioxygenase family protein [Alphaproteobacteria bacterium]
MRNLLNIRRLDAALGAEIIDLDLSKPLDEAVFSEVKAAWDENLVLLFRDQKISDDDLIAFSRLFGDLDKPGVNPQGKPYHPTQPYINVISNLKQDGVPLGNLGDGEAVWHADMTYEDNPPVGAVLHGLTIPPEGGATYFANMFAAYDALDTDTKALIDDKVAIHDGAHNSAGMLRRGYVEETDVMKTPGARHSLVRDFGGRKALFLGRRPHSYIVGMAVPESEALLDRIWAHASQDKFSFRHEWRVGDVLMWANQRVLHKRDAFDPNSRRIMHRTQISERSKEIAA